MSSRHIANALKRRDFVGLWAGSVAASFAMNMQIIARGWLVYAMTESATDLALVTLSFMAPQVFLSLWGGVVADRFVKRRILIIAQLSNCVATVAMAAIIMAGRVTFADFIWFGLFNGSVLAFSMPARHAFVPDLVPRRLIFTAMALNTAGMNLARVLGPVIAGFVIAWAAAGDTTSARGVGIVYCLIAALYFIAAATVFFVQSRGAPRQGSGASPLADMREGIAYVYAHPPVKGLILLSIVPFLFGMPMNTLLPAFNQDILGGGADDLGLLVSAMGVGAIVGSVTLAAAGELRRKRTALLALSAGWALSVAALGVAGNMAWAMLVVAAFGWMSSSTMALNRGLLQTQTTYTMRGRVMSIDMMCHGLMPLGAIPIGLIADAFGVAAALLASGALFALTVAGMARFSFAVQRIGTAVA